MAKAHLTESQIISIVENATRRVIKTIMESKANEISDDTVFSARNGAYNKWRKIEKDPYTSVEEKEVARKQYQRFNDEYNKRKFQNTSEKRRAVMNKNERDIDSGKRTFNNGKWTTKED